MTLNLRKRVEVIVGLIIKKSDTNPIIKGPSALTEYMGPIDMDIEI